MNAYDGPTDFVLNFPEGGSLKNVMMIIKSESDNKMISMYIDRDQAIMRFNAKYDGTVFFHTLILNVQHTFSPRPDSDGNIPNFVKIGFYPKALFNSVKSIKKDSVQILRLHSDYDTPSLIVRVIKQDNTEPSGPIYVNIHPSPDILSCSLSDIESGVMVSVPAKIFLSECLLINDTGCESLILHGYQRGIVFIGKHPTEGQKFYHPHGFGPIPIDCRRFIQETMGHEFINQLEIPKKTVKSLSRFGTISDPTKEIVFTFLPNKVVIICHLPGKRGCYIIQGAKK